MRLVLVGGRGGVGRTTAAVATAAAAGARGSRVLVASVDGPHSLSDALGVPLGADPVPVGPGVDALQVDPREALERRWPRLRSALAPVLARLDAVPGIDALPAAEVAVPPGVGELLALLEVRDRVAAGDWDAVLLDAGPTVRLLPMLALPEALSGQLERLWPTHRRIVRALSPGLGRPAAALPDVVGPLRAALAGVRELLATGTVRLVLTPEAPAVADARRTLTALALHGYPVDSVLANRVLPAEAGDAPWPAAVRAAQAAALDGLDPALPVRRLAYLPEPPVGFAALRALGAAAYGAADPLAPGPAVEPPAVSRSGSEYVLRVALPYVRRSEVRLARSGDELVVTVGDQLRRLELPSVLRRCVAVGASAGDGAVRVRFRPDPAQWPQELSR